MRGVVRWTVTHNSAKALQQLKTSKGKSRLFPKSRCHQLLPAEPISVQERKDVANALIGCQTMKDDKAKKSELTWAIKYCLLNSNSSRAGIRFTDTNSFKRFMQVVSQLFPWRRWQLLLQYPKDKRLTHWNMHKELVIDRLALKRQEPFPEGLGYLYLRHAKEEQLIQRGLNRYSSHSLRILFHRLAIILFNPENIKQWQ
ncbi:hypothetical protein [Shewanella sp. SNU WT4]|uniref:hypothetical protein n=1 Tax=Shewanella sp. SNU WT4 TaxID=2590015 RepID=UPI00143D68A5|nr:hypothetical protein [Shewanella sp. SNU WT4]